MNAARVLVAARTSAGVAFVVPVQQVVRNGEEVTCNALTNKGEIVSLHRILNPVNVLLFALGRSLQVVVGSKSLARNRSPEPASLKRAAR